MVSMVAKLGVFSLSDDKDDESVEEADVSSNKSEISSESIRAKMYACKMFKTSFHITFSGSWSIISDVFGNNEQHIAVSEVFAMIA